ncbi:LPS-assembly lipoprotein LptE [compost metagenome]
MLDYQIVGQNNLSLISDKLQVQKVVMHDGSNITGSVQEADEAQKEMRRDLVQRMMLRLQQLSPAQLDQLQQSADARAKAEAQALEAAQKAEANTPRQSPLQVPAE